MPCFQTVTVRLQFGNLLLLQWKHNHPVGEGIR